jgi:hypothetical protein
MRFIKIIILLALPALLFVKACSNEKHFSLNITPVNQFPRWLKDSNYVTDQTSGIAFIEQQQDNKKLFLLADDVGKIYRLVISNDTIFTLHPFAITGEAEALVSKLPKADFEEIMYDNHTGKVYLSIEGNGENYKNHVGVYEVKFKDNNINSGVITDFIKLKITPEAEFLKYTAPNIGFEGMAVDANYFYFGLEGFTAQNIFADSTLLYIVDKKSLEIKKVISTKEYGIHTICGLHSPADNILLGIDRNSRKIFYTSIDNSLNLEEVVFKEINPAIPGYSHLTYVAAIEAITVDNEGGVYLVDDPWKKFFIPDAETLKQTDETTEQNFKNFIPIIYKYN